MISGDIRISLCRSDLTTFSNHCSLLCVVVVFLDHWTDWDQLVHEEAAEQPLIELPLEHAMYKGVSL